MKNAKYTVKVRCRDCGKIFESPVFIRNGKEYGYPHCHICRQIRINYNTTLGVYNED